MKDKYFKEENITNIISFNVDDCEFEDSKDYSITITSYVTGSYKWPLTECKVFYKNKLIYTARRNDYYFFYKFIKYKNDNIYFIYSHDYYSGGYVIFDLTNKKEFTYSPDSKNHYLIWSDIVSYENELNELIVYGFYNGDKQLRVTYSLEDPTSLPLKIISEEYLEI